MLQKKTHSPKFFLCCGGCAFPVNVSVISLELIRGDIFNLLDLHECKGLLNRPSISLAGRLTVFA
jgi:hypothetical protein